jgi:hypothetical protein
MGPALGLVLALAGPAWAAVTHTVTDCGDATPVGSPGQLRRLIDDAAPGDTIVIPACTITLTGSAALEVQKDLTIQGAGPSQTIIDGHGTNRVVHVHATVTVAISRLTIRNGPGGGLVGGGGVFNEGTLTLTRVAVTGNSAGGPSRRSNCRCDGVAPATPDGGVPDQGVRPPALRAVSAPMGSGREAS